MRSYFSNIHQEIKLGIKDFIVIISRRLPYAVYCGRLRTNVWLLIDAFGPDMLGGLKPSF